MGALRTVVVEDERLARRKLVMLLSTEPGIELVGESGTAEGAVSLLRDEHPADAENSPLEEVAPGNLSLRPRFENLPAIFSGALGFLDPALGALLGKKK